MALLKRVWERLNAAQLASLSFIAVIFAGSFVLMLPISHRGRLHYVDALFTSTSAVCVTGLTVVDTGTKFTGFGQAVILALIQIGGLGVMTLSTFLLFLMKKRASLQASDAVGGSFLKLRYYSLSKMIAGALFITLSFEAVGAVALFIRWLPDHGAAGAVWHAIFHSVSAFCNAGFSLNSDGLVSYADDPAVNLVIMSLVIFGGIGFFVIIDLWDTVSRHPEAVRRRLSFHSRIVLTMTVMLAIGGALALFLVERRYNFYPLTPYQAGIRSLFQSVTARTAGFNTVNIGQLSDVSLFILIFLMFVGAAPGSTAGGVKVTTLGVLIMVVISRVRRMSMPGFFGRSVDRRDLERALALVFLASVLIAGATMLLLSVETGGAPHPQTRGMFLELFFEVVSAFGTVGLSTGVTPKLEPASKIALSVLMLVGRVGPMTLIYAMSRSRPGAGYHYPSEQIMIG